MGCILVRIIEHEKFELYYNKIKFLNNDLIEKGTLYIKNCNCKCNTKEISNSGVIGYNVDTLISSYVNRSKCCKIRRAVNNQIYPEGSLESRVDEALNTVFLFLASLCEFYDYEHSKAIYDTFVLPVLNKLDNTEFDNTYRRYNDTLHNELLSVYQSNSIHKFKNGIEWLIRPFIMESFFGRIWFNIVDGTENYKAFKHIIWHGFDTELALSNRAL